MSRNLPHNHDRWLATLRYRGRTYVIDNIDIAEELLACETKGLMKGFTNVLIVDTIEKLKKSTGFLEP